MLDGFGNYQEIDNSSRVKVSVLGFRIENSQTEVIDGMNDRLFIETGLR